MLHRVPLLALQIAWITSGSWGLLRAQGTRVPAVDRALIVYTASGTIREGLVVYHTTPGNPPSGGGYRKLESDFNQRPPINTWPGAPTPAPTNLRAVDYDAVSGVAYVLTTTNGGQVWKTDLSTYTTQIGTIVNPFSGLFNDIAVYRDASNSLKIVISNTTVFGTVPTLGVFDEATGWLGGIGQHSLSNSVFRQIDAGNISSVLNLPGVGANFAVALTSRPGGLPPVLECFDLSNPSGVFLRHEINWPCNGNNAFPYCFTINSSAPLQCPGGQVSEIVLAGVLCTAFATCVTDLLTTSPLMNAQFLLRWTGPSACGNPIPERMDAVVPFPSTPPPPPPASTPSYFFTVPVFNTPLLHWIDRSCGNAPCNLCVPFTCTIPVPPAGAAIDLAAIR